MGLWRAHDNDDEMQGGGVLGALSIMLGLYLIAGLWEAHARESQRTGKGDLGWATFLILASLGTILVVLT